MKKAWQITGENQWSDPITVAPDTTALFLAGGTFVATLRLQARISPGDWVDSGTVLTAPGGLNYRAPTESVELRAGVATGDFSSGSIDLSAAWAGS